MRFNIHDIPSEGIDFKATASDRWFTEVVAKAFPEDFRKGNTASLNLYLIKTCENVSITGESEVDLFPACDRCLENFPTHLTVPIGLVLSPAPEQERGKGASLTEEDLNFAFYTGGTIDIDEIVREFLVLALPIRFLCSEKCKGICQHCGQNLNQQICSCAPPPNPARFGVLKNIRVKK